MTKTRAVLDYLQENTGITTFEAFTKFGATRLSDIVYRLKKQGHNIVTVNREQEDRYGNKVTFCEYRLVEK